MIKSIRINNFRCFENLTIEGCERINVIVGDNGTGKTALLEALFLALAGNTSVALRLRQWRGLEGLFAGTPRDIEEGLWGGFFYRFDMNRGISIALSGSGLEARSLYISRSKDDILIPLSENDHSSSAISMPVEFVWKDSGGHEHRYIPKVTAAGLEAPASEEQLPDFFFFAATHNTGAGETATRFSRLSRARQSSQFVNLFLEEYQWIEDLSIEAVGGTPVIHATVKNIPEKIPLNLISGAINRMVGILLAIASHPKSVVLVDEAENGVYYKHHAAYWRNLLSFARTYDTQLFISTHSEEFLEALVSAAGNDISDVALWRMEYSGQTPIVRQFSGETLKAGIEEGGEVR